MFSFNKKNQMLFFITSYSFITPNSCEQCIMWKRYENELNDVPSVKIPSYSRVIGSYPKASSSTKILLNYTSRIKHSINSADESKRKFIIDHTRKHARELVSD